MNATTGISLIIIIVMIALAYYLWRFLFARALRSVVAAFREHGALDAKRAMTLEALGFPMREGILANMFRPRDYRGQVLQVLGREGIVRMVEGEKFYLSEETLSRSARLRKFAKID